MKTTEHTESTEGVNFDLTGQVIGCAIEAHTTLVPGLLESTYEQCLAHELRLAKVDFRVQSALPVLYKGILLDCGYRVDILVDEYLVIELKAVEHLTSVHEAHILTYMKLGEASVGLLINFNTKLLKDGIRRFSL